MQKPESALKRLLRDKQDADIKDLLYDHAERVALWERVVGKLRRSVSKASEDLEEWRGLRFVQYWTQCEKGERDEMNGHLSDEDEVDKDPFHPGRKAKREAYRIQKGVDAARWRRNFTDDFINSMVSSDAKVVTLKKNLRIAKYELDQALAVREALHHRQTCLNHLAALHRDTSRQ